MLTNRTSQRVEIPHEPGEWVELKPLSWTDLERARTARLKSVVETMRDAAEVIALLQGRTPDAVPDTDPLSPYDRATILKAGIVGWSYGAPLDEENLASLDEETAVWIAQQLVAARSEADRKNASSTSTKR